MAGTEQIGIVGVGRMGQAMTKHLIKRGYAVLAHDIEPKALEAVRTAGAETVNTPAEVGKACTFVIIAVGYDDEAAAVVLGKKGASRNNGHRSGDRNFLHLHTRARQDAGGAGAR